MLSIWKSSLSLVLQVISFSSFGNIFCEFFDIFSKSLSFLSMTTMEMSDIFTYFTNLTHSLHTFVAFCRCLKLLRLLNCHQAPSLSLTSPFLPEAFHWVFIWLFQLFVSTLSFEFLNAFISLYWIQIYSFLLTYFPPLIEFIYNFCVLLKKCRWTFL